MTHDEALALLPAYALGALDDTAALEAHLRGCARCARTLASYLETTATLSEAVEPIPPPPSLRASVLAHLPPTRPRWWTRQTTWLSTAAAALLVVSLGLGAVSVAQQRQLGALQTELALDRSGLDLLTSTETTVERLNPVGATPSVAHGHWYHHPGVATQVVVVEFMPPPPPGEAYYGWLQRIDGSWRALGAFALDDRGYGRIILTGDDGTVVRSVVITRQKEPSAAPGGEIVVRDG